MPFEEALRSVALPLVRFCSFAANALLFGLVPICLLVLRPSFARLPAGDGWDKGRKRLSTRLEGFVQASLVGSAIATVIWLLLQTLLTSSFLELDFDLDTFGSVAGTTAGQWNIYRFPVLIALAILLIGRVRTGALAGTGEGGRSPKAMWWAAWSLLSGVLLLSSTMTGHSTVATPKIVAILNDLIHLIAGSTWFAGIVILAVALPDGWRGQDEHGRLKLLAPVVIRFSKVALVSISIVAVTGSLASFLHLGHLNDLIDTAYGRALGLKILFFIAILGLGALNHFVLRHKLEEGLDQPDASPGTAQRLFRKSIATELVVALVILGLTGILTGESRTRDAPEPPQDTAAVTRR